jgi:trans-aconitate 2-methyltransferase
MTEWNASGYDRISTLQDAMAQEVLSLLRLGGSERVLDVGCGNGRVTAEIADRVQQGSIVGIDPSNEMVAFAAQHFNRPNVHYEVGDARQLRFKSEFDLVVSFNALHWIREVEQGHALRSIRAALRPSGLAQLRLVPKGQRQSLEDVTEETRRSARWSPYFDGFHDPYLHLTPEQYATLAEDNGFRVQSLNTSDHAWNFGSRAGFVAFGAVTFVEWSKYIPELERLEFVEDVLDRYRQVLREDGIFRFYQMDITLKPK